MTRRKLTFPAKLARSFYLTLRVVPKTIRHQVTLAYFIARAADTVADTQAVPSTRRLQFIEQLKGCLHKQQLYRQVCDQIAGSLSRMQATEAERELVRSLPLMFEAHHQLSPDDRERATRLLATLMNGMVFDLARFPTEATGKLRGVETADELALYTYSVAGVVGEYWTEMLAGHFPALARQDIVEMKRLGVCLGRGLQLINILRDLPRDLANGRCYLPAEDLSRVGISLETLPTGEAHAKCRPLFLEAITRADKALEAGLSYLRFIPRRMLRNRLAVAWPALIGAATLRELRGLSDPFDPAVTAKVARPEVYQILATSLLIAFSNRAIEQFYTRLRG